MGAPGCEGACTARHSDHSRWAWQSALAVMQKKLLANRGRVCGSVKDLYVVFAVDADGDDGDVDAPYHCHGDGPSQSLGAETVSCCCHGGGGGADQIAMAFLVSQTLLGLNHYHKRLQNG